MICGSRLILEEPLLCVSGPIVNALPLSRRKSNVCGVLRGWFEDQAECVAGHVRRQPFALEISGLRPGERSGLQCRLYEGKRVVCILRSQGWVRASVEEAGEGGELGVPGSCARSLQALSRIRDGLAEHC